MSHIPSNYPTGQPVLFGTEILAIGNRVAAQTDHEIDDVRRLLASPCPDEDGRKVCVWLEDIVLAHGDFSAGLKAAERLLRDLVYSHPI